MAKLTGSQKPLLQRRSSISNTIQAGLDGLAVIAIISTLVEYHIGLFTSPYVILLLLLMGILAVVYDHYSIYRTNASFYKKSLILLKAWTVSIGLLLTISFLGRQSDYYSRILIGELYILGFLAQLALRYLIKTAQRYLVVHANHPDNVIIVGDGQLADYLSDRITSNPWLGQNVLGTVVIREKSSTQSTPQSAGKQRILGHIWELPEIIERLDVQAVYIVTPLDITEVIEELYFDLLDKHVAVHWVPDIFSLRLVNHSIKEIAGIPVFTLSETPLTGIRLLTKFLEDIVLSSLILVTITPILLIIAIAIKIDSPGPVFFQQKRMGWNGKTFFIWKFRSMVAHESEDGIIKQAVKCDPRVTRIGAFLRKTSLDELPQLFNVLLGDMSLVGPRPHAIQHDLEYSKRISDYFARHNIKPGMTGLAQVRGLRGETKTIKQMAERVDSDIEYINNWSLWLDLIILIRTTRALTGKHAY